MFSDYFQFSCGLAHCVDFKRTAVYAIHIISYFHFFKKNVLISKHIFMPSNCFESVLFRGNFLSARLEGTIISIQCSERQMSVTFRQTKKMLKSKLIYVNQNICLTNSNITTNLSYEATQTKSANIAQFSIRSHFTKNQ